MQPHNPQDSSLFFWKLPAEVRLEIYSHVFYSTRLSFGGRVMASETVSSSHRLTDPVNLTRVTLRPAPNSLSLLRVCHRVNGEIGHSWIGQALFSFEGGEAMLGKLAALEPSVLAKLRHMRISGHQPVLFLGNDYGTMQRGWACMLKVLPGLCLDSLTILGDITLLGEISTLVELIKHSDGWKELYYLTHNSAILDYPGQFWWPADVHGAQRPSTFDTELVNRDGPTASVRIYRSIHTAEYGQMLSKPATREPFSGRLPVPSEEQRNGRNSARMTHEELRKEVLFVARRGKGVDYAVRPGSSLLPNDTREVKVYQRRKRRGIRSESKVDTYKHVDEYEWTPSHMERAED